MSQKGNSPSSSSAPPAERARRRAGGVPKAAESVYESLRRSVLSGELAPGLRLRQAELAAELGVSLIPLREAITRLTAEGLVRVRPRLGAYVAELSAADARELYAMKAALEPLALREAASRSGDDEFAAARRIVDELDGVHEPMRYAELNQTFHLALYEPCGMPRLLEAIQRIWDATFRYSTFWRRTRVDAVKNQDEHRQILTALESGDVDKACHVLEGHIRRAGVRICALAESDQGASGDGDR